MDLEATWKSVLAALKLAVSEGTYNTFIKPAILLSATETGGRLVCEIGCPSAMVRDTLEKRYWGQIAQLLKNLTEKDCELVFSVHQTSKDIDPKTQDVGPLFAEKIVTADTLRQARLKPLNTFENYAVGSSNQMAHAAATAVSQHPGGAYNPLFIYGGVGVGKTHLMQAIGHAVLGQGEDRILFCSAEEFTNDLVEGIKNKSTDKVRAKYRRLKLMLIDDVQFIAGRNTVQEEFFHTFNSLLGENSQVVMTSDRPPAEINKLEERLKSRFGAGMVVDIGPADLELRTAVLLIKSRQRDIPLPIELARLAAEHIEGLRELEGFLVRLASEVSAQNQPPSIEMAEKLLRLPQTINGRPKIITPSEVINLISAYYGVGVQQLKGPRRTQTIAWPRQILMHLLRADLHLPFEEVGRLIGGRDHTTVMHADDKVKHQALTSPQFLAQLEDIRKRLLISSGQAN